MMRRPTAPRRTAYAAILAAALAAVLTGCMNEPLTRSPAEYHAVARTSVADLARGLDGHDTGIIDDYARWADAATRPYRADGGVELIGFEAYEDAVNDEPFGALQFRVTVPPALYDDEPYVACFESEFGFGGVATDEFGGWSDDAAVARDIDCPADARRIPPPVDTRPIMVVPEGTEALVVEILANAPEAASAERIVAEVTERMPQPTGDREFAFDAHAVVTGADIGFAMGVPDDCLLVKRSAGVVEVLNVPSILLEPGELGCRPETALLPDDLLRSPH